MTIAIDFDGTICRSEFPTIKGQMPYVQAAMHKLHEAGHYMIIWTCREGNDLVNAINWLKDNDIPFDRINDNHESNIKMYNNNSRKISADVYIDDKNLGGFPGWEYVVAQLT